MSSSSLKQPPALDPLRVTSVGDILRLGIVCTAGFSFAEQFVFERPYHDENPHVSLLAFRHEVKKFIESPKHMVLVATNQYEPDESSKWKL